MGKADGKGNVALMDAILTYAYQKTGKEAKIIKMLKMPKSTVNDWIRNNVKTVNPQVTSVISAEDDGVIENSTEDSPRSGKQRPQ